MNALLAALLAAGPYAAECRSDVVRQVDSIRRSEWVECRYTGYCSRIGMYLDSATGEWKVGTGEYQYGSDCQGRQWVHYERPVYEDGCGRRSEGSERETHRDTCL